MFRKYKAVRVTVMIALPVFIMAGCKKFLDVPPQGQLTEEEFATNPDAAQNLVNGVYNSLYFGGFDKNTVGFLYAIATEVASDDADKGSFEADFGPAKEIDNFTHTPTNFIFDNIWRGYYSGIARANQAINALENSAFDEARKNQLIGEVRFIRGLYYFNLVRFFGGVPKIIRVPNATEANSDEFQTRASKEEIYQVVIDDLQFAATNLPLKGEATTQTGRANKGAAQALLAKVYLYQKDWQKAFDLSKEVINSGKYSLETNFENNFRQTSTNTNESVFEVQSGLTANCNAISPLFSNGQGPRAGGAGGWNDLGFGLNTPTADLANTYGNEDKRRDATIIFIQPTVAAGPNPGTILWDGFRVPTKDSVQNERYNYKAYAPTPESGPCAGNKDLKPKNIPIIRYAEVLLIYAEAAAMLGQTGEALDKLRMVRERAGIMTTTSATQQDVWDERRRELAMEQDRFFDLVRQERAGTVLRAHGKAFVDNKNEVFPIPQSQIDLSGGRLTQNPGY
jgi:tetratricopeptide (TPR) repeat protein